MKLLTFSRGGRTIFGAKVGAHIVDLSELVASTKNGKEVEAFPENLDSFLQAGEGVRRVAQSAIDAALKSQSIGELAKKGSVYNEEEIAFLPPVTRPGKIICLGMNYRKHAQEMGREPPQYPTLFAKYPHTLIGHKNPLVLPTISQMVDYEAELAIVIGKAGKSIKAEHALDHVAGYTILNDISVRDFQNRTLQWFQGKNFERSCPVGPYLVTKDEVPDPDKLEIELKLNDKIMQRSNTSDFIFSVSNIIEYISQIMTLQPGDIISTGTPGGVGVARDPQVFLKPGDVVRISLQDVGLLENTAVKAAG
jgi:acylpyruvate hydrolase